MFDRVLICTDFSDGLLRLGQFLESLSLGGMKQIVFLHIVSLSEKGVIPRVDVEKMKQARSRLEGAVGESPAGVEVKIEIQSGQIVQKILQAAQEYQSELIVVGSQSQTLFTEKLMGSTMAALSQQTAIPLFVIRPQLISAYTSEELNLRCQHLFRSLLLPYDDSEPAKYLVQQVKHLAGKQTGRFLERCELCWVEDSLTPPQAYNTLSQLKIDLEEVNLQVEIGMRQGHSCSTEILQAAQTADVSAIAVSTGTIGKLQEWFVSSFASELLRHSCRPVIFFPPRR